MNDSERRPDPAPVVSDPQTGEVAQLDTGDVVIGAPPATSIAKPAEDGE